MPPDPPRLFSGVGEHDELGDEAAGLRAISDGFPLVARTDDETMEKAAFLYDALYASLRERTGGTVR